MLQMEVNSKDAQLQEKTNQISWQQQELHALRVRNRSCASCGLAHLVTQC